jgi:phosphopentomutase
MFEGPSSAEVRTKHAKEKNGRASHVDSLGRLLIEALPEVSRESGMDFGSIGNAASVGTDVIEDRLGFENANAQAVKKRSSHDGREVLLIAALREAVAAGRNVTVVKGSSRITFGEDVEDTMPARSDPGIANAPRIEHKNRIHEGSLRLFEAALVFFVDRGAEMLSFLEAGTVVVDVSVLVLDKVATSDVLRLPCATDDGLKL